VVRSVCFSQVDERVSLEVRLKALTFASFIAMFLDNASAATAYGREAVTLAETAGEQGKQLLPLALAALASGARVAMDFPTAFAIQERFIAWARESGDTFNLGMSLLAQGGIAIELGFYEEALILLDESLGWRGRRVMPFGPHTLSIAWAIWRAARGTTHKP